MLPDQQQLERYVPCRLQFSVAAGKIEKPLDIEVWMGRKMNLIGLRPALASSEISFAANIKRSQKL
jgi:hypothetical protein